MKNTKVPQSLKGFRDIFPDEARKRQWLKNKIIEVFEKWGFEPFETPTLEPLELFEGQIGEDEKLFYKFTDNGGRRVALRYDQTVPICRVMANNRGKIELPFKRYQIQPAFRAEKPQSGRYREFLQCDADIFGVKGPYADAEMIALTLDIYKQIGFKNAKVLVNDRSLFKNIPYEAIVAIDKLDKIGEAGVIEDMEKKGIETAQAKKYMEYVKNIKPNNTIKVIQNYLLDYGFPKEWFQFVPTIARSFSYSDGPIWEVKIAEYKSGSVLGGERFNDLVNSISGVDIPGVGFGLGFDRTLEAAEVCGLIDPSIVRKKVLLTVFSDSLISETIKIASQLRSLGVNLDMYSDPTVEFRKQLKYANKKGYDFVVILGEDEVKNNKIAVKDLKSGKQELLDVNEVVKMLGNR